MRLTSNQTGWAVIALVAVLFAGLLWTVSSALDDEAPGPEAAAVAPGRAESAAAGIAPIAEAAAAQDALPEGEADVPALVRCQEAHRDALRQRTDALATRRDARSRLAFALLAQGLFAGEPRMSAQHATRAIEHAVALAPNDPYAAWLRALDCAQRGDCGDAAGERLLQLEPGNLGAWLIAIGAAVREGRTAQAEALLLQAAESATYFDAHWADSNRVLLAGLRPLPALPACTEASAGIAELLELERLGTPDDLTVMTVHTVSTAQLPALNGVFRLCPPRGALPRGRRDACRAVYARLAESDELLYRNVGVRAMTRYAATLEERRRWRERLRDLAWLVQEGGPLLRGSHLPLVWEQGEVPVMVALLEERKRWPAPPRWRPRDRETRLLIDPPPPPKRRKRRR